MRRRRLCDQLYDVPLIPYLKLRFTLLAAAACFLAPRKGSMLRGAFGNALRRTVCVMPPKQACEPCMLRRQCIYTRLFETFVEEPAPRFLRGLPTAPRPNVFEPFDLAREFAPGAPGTFLVGPPPGKQQLPGRRHAGNDVPNQPGKQPARGYLGIQQERYVRC